MRKLRNWIDSYVEYSQNSEPSEMYRLWSAVSVISSVLQRKCRFEWGTLTFYPNMYVVLVGPPAARKGTAMSQAYHMLDDLDVKVAAEAITREALIRELSKATHNDVSTGEGLILSMHSSLTIWSQELTVFLGYQNYQLMSDLTDWYDCRDRWTYRTKNMGTDEITGVYVNLFGATTPDLVRSSLPIDAIGGGLTSRMIFVFEPNKGKVVPYPGLSDKEIELEQILRQDLAHIHMLSGRFRADRDFLNKWIEWYPEQERNPPFDDRRFAGYCERRANHVIKLSMIVSAAESDDLKVTKAHLNRAIDILIETEKKMQQTFAGVGRSNMSEVLTMVMTDLMQAEELPKSYLVDKYKNDADAWMMDKIIETLRESNFLQTVVKGTTDYLRYIPGYGKKINIGDKEDRDG